MMTAMEDATVPRRTPLIQIGAVPQLVPSRICLTCEVCCRFPEHDSFLRPYFSADEIRHAIDGGIDPHYFPDPEGGQIGLVPNADGEGYHCPAFDPETSHCRIYEVRPLDCQIYPLAVMWTHDRSGVVLGWDIKCPFLATDAAPDQPAENRRAESFARYADTIAGLLEHPEMVDRIAANPQLITSFQDDVVLLRPLSRLTERLTGLPVPAGAFGEERSRLTAPPQPSSNRAVRQAHPVAHAHLRPLVPADYARFTSALDSVRNPMAAYALAPHVMWNDFFQYSWAEVEGQLCLFAEYQDGLFMPLPPMGAGSLEHAVAWAFAVMRHRNGGSAVSRIENIAQEFKPVFDTLGYRLAGKDPDYLYEAKKLVELAGDPYKSPRAACNRFKRERRSRYGPYDRRDAGECLELYRRWAVQKDYPGLDPIARHMLHDAELAHRRVLLGESMPDLFGRAMWVDDRLAAYTFGYPRGSDVFCILLEVADRSIPGLAAFLFRTVSAEAVEAGYRFINTMDDSGLRSLARSKQGYRPAALVANYIATES